MVSRCQSVIAELNVGRIATELLNYGKGIAIRYRLYAPCAAPSKVHADASKYFPGKYQLSNIYTMMMTRLVQSHWPT